MSQQAGYTLVGHPRRCLRIIAVSADKLAVKPKPSADGQPNSPRKSRVRRVSLGPAALSPRDALFTSVSAVTPDCLGMGCGEIEV